MATEISFYDESLKKQIDGTIVLDGREITVLSAYGAKSAPDHLGAFVDRNAQELVARKLLAELARDPGSGKFKDVQQQRDDQQLQPMQRPVQDSGCSYSGAVGGGGANPGTRAGSCQKVCGAGPRTVLIAIGTMHS